MSGGDVRVQRVQPVSTRLPDDLAAMLRAEAERNGTGITELLREGALLRLALAGAGSADVADLLRAVGKLERQLLPRER
jgi:hypothetical protein